MSKSDNGSLILDDCVKFDPVNGSHIPNVSALSSRALSRAIRLGDTNKCVVCSRRTAFSTSNKRFNKGCCATHTYEARRGALKLAWAAKSDSLKAETNSKIRATMLARYGVPTAGALPQHATAVQSAFGGPTQFDQSLSQNANMHNCGWVRVFDAGQTRWIMDRA